jgi:hypothetical protein
MNGVTPSSTPPSAPPLPGFPPPPVEPAATPESEQRDAASLEEYLVEYLCRERISDEEMKELLISDAFQRFDY